MSRFSDLSQAIQEMQEASASDNGDKGYLVTIASVAPDSVGSSHVRAFVLPYFPQNTARASNASAVISPNPLGTRPGTGAAVHSTSTVAHCRCLTCRSNTRRCPASGRGIGVTWQIPIFQPPSSKRRFCSVDSLRHLP